MAKAHSLRLEFTVLGLFGVVPVVCHVSDVTLSSFRMSNCTVEVSRPWLACQFKSRVAACRSLNLLAPECACIFANAACNFTHLGQHR
jgi:hypothetical protein